MYKRSFLATALLTTSLAYPQHALAINITPSSDAFALVNSLIVNSPVSIFGGSTPVFSGQFGQAGIYRSPQGTYGLPTAGIVLSSGTVTDYQTLPLGTDPEPEEEFDDQFNGAEAGRTTNFGVLATPVQNDLLDDITGLPEHFDPAQLDFEFVVNEDVEVVTSQPAFSSTADGQFTIKGAGLQTCAAFSEAFDAGSSDLASYAGWLDGFVTGGGTVVYEAVLARVADRLRELGHLTGEAGDRVSETEMTSALAAFQTAEDLPPSGGPDQATLMRLFVR